MQKSDAQRSIAFRRSPFPVSPERTEEWITDDLAEAESSTSFVYAIVRTNDEVLIGSVAFEQGVHCRFDITGWVAPVFGERGQHWQAEALTVASDWLTNELESPAVLTNLPATETIVIESLQRNGFVITSCLREKCFVDGKRTDELMLTRFNDAWIETLGDPMSIELPTSGTGIARPSPVRQMSRSSAPKNAVMVGERVYLRPTTEADLAEDMLWQRRESDLFHSSGRRLLALDAIIKDVGSDEKEDPMNFVFFSVCERETDVFIGVVGLAPVDYSNRTAETASWFHRPEFRGQGFGTEAKHLLLEYAFDVLGLHMIESTVRFGNTRSAAALRKQGYRDAGRKCWNGSLNGSFGNYATFDLLADEWRALSPKHQGSRKEVRT